MENIGICTVIIVLVAIIATVLHIPISNAEQKDEDTFQKYCVLNIEKDADKCKDLALKIWHREDWVLEHAQKDGKFN